MGVDGILAIAMGHRKALVDPTPGRERSRHRRGRADPLVERSQEESRHAAARSPCRADSTRVEIGPGGKIVDRPASVEQLDGER
jgi:hypothetical protein